MPSMPCLDGLWDGGVSGCTAVASRICSKQYAVSLCSSHLAFPASVSLKSKWCSHTVLFTQLQLGRILVLFYQRSNFHMVHNLSIAVYDLPMCILTSLSVDEILLLKYMNCSTNFRGFLFNEVIVLFWLNTWTQFYLSLHKDDTFCCLLQAMQ